MYYVNYFMEQQHKAPGLRNLALRANNDYRTLTTQPGAFGNVTLPLQKTEAKWSMAPKSFEFVMERPI